MGSESLAHEAEGLLNFSWLKLVDFNPFFAAKKPALLLLVLVGYTIWPSSSSTNQNAALIIDHLAGFY